MEQEKGLKNYVAIGFLVGLFVGIIIIFINFINGRLTNQDISYILIPIVPTSIIGTIAGAARFSDKHSKHSTATTKIKPAQDNILALKRSCFVAIFIATLITVLISFIFPIDALGAGLLVGVGAILFLVRYVQVFIPVFIIAWVIVFFVLLNKKDNNQQPGV